MLKADAFPQYTWYNELSDRNEFGGRYNGSLYGFFNRMTVELQGASFQQYQSYSSEIDSPVFQTSFAATAKFDLELGSRLALFGQGVYQDVTYEQIEGPPVQEGGVPNNDRTGTGIRGGLRYGLSPDFNVGVVAEGTFSDFEFQPEFRNNSSTAILASVEFNRSRLFLNLLGGYREGTNANSTLPAYSTGVGSFFVSYFFDLLARAPGLRSPLCLLQHLGVQSLLLREPDRRKAEHPARQPRPDLRLHRGRTRTTTRARSRSTSTARSSSSSAATRPRSTAAAFRSSCIGRSCSPSA